MQASLEVGWRAIAVVISCAGLAAAATACGTAQLSPSAPAARATQSGGPLAEWSKKWAEFERLAMNVRRNPGPDG